MAYEGRPFLLVDDDPLVLSSVGRMIRHAARRPVVGARSFGEALDAIESRTDWLGLVLDVQLGSQESDPTGFDVLQSARRAMPSIEAIMLTGQLDADLINRAARASAAYVCKPTSLDDLRPFIDRALAADSLPDPRVAAAADAVVRAARLESKRAAELLRLSLSGHTPEEVAEIMRITDHTYTHHVSLLLRATGARSIEQLVNRILRAAVGTVRG